MVQYPEKPYFLRASFTTYLQRFGSLETPTPPDPLFSLRSQITTSQLLGWLS